MNLSASAPTDGAEPVTVLRGLLDHALTEWLHGGVDEFSRWEEADWASSSWTDAEKAELWAALARLRAAAPGPEGSDRP